MKKTVAGSLAAVYATYEFYRLGGIEAAIAVPVVISGVYALNALSEKLGWGGWAAEAAPYPPDVNWLDDAYASRQRGTGINTLAVRYDVDPDWLADELSRFASTPRT